MNEVNMLRCAVACALEPGVVGLVEHVDDDIVPHARSLDGGQRVNAAHQVDPVLRPLLRAPRALLREQDLRARAAASGTAAAGPRPCVLHCKQPPGQRFDQPSLVELLARVVCASAPRRSLLFAARSLRQVVHPVHPRPPQPFAQVSQGVGGRVAFHPALAGLPGVTCSSLRHYAGQPCCCYPSQGLHLRS